MPHFICATSEVKTWHLSSQSCKRLDSSASILLALLVLVLAFKFPRCARFLILGPLKVTFRMVKSQWRRHKRFDFFERHGYAYPRYTGKGEVANGRTIYPSASWQKVKVGSRTEKKAVLKVTFPAGVKRTKLETDLDLWSGAWGVWFFDVRPDDADPRIYYFQASATPNLVDFSDMPAGLSPMTAFLGISERLEPVTRALSEQVCAGLYAPPGAGKSVFAANYLKSVHLTTPGVRKLVITTKQLALFRAVPGTEVLNAFVEADMNRLSLLIRQLTTSAEQLMEQLDQHGAETLEELYAMGIVSPITSPRWIMILDESKDYLKLPRKPTSDRPRSIVETSHGELVDFLAIWFRKFRCLSRHVLVCLQDPSAGAIPIELDALSFKIIGRMREPMARVLVQSDRPAREAIPKGVFFLHAENDLVKFRGPFEAGPNSGGQRKTLARLQMPAKIQIRSKSSRVKLAPLSTDHPLARSSFDEVRLVAPTLSLRDLGANPCRVLGDLVGVPVKKMRGNTTIAFETECGIAIFVESRGTRFDFNGKFWCLLGYDDSRGIAMVRQLAINIHAKFDVKSHLTRVDAMREFIGPDVSPLTVLPLPTKRIYWSFLGKASTPENKFGGIWVKNPRASWTLRVYSKRLWLNERCKDPTVLSAHLARWHKAGVDNGQEVVRLEIGLTGVNTLRSMTELLYAGGLESTAVWPTWIKRRSIRQCPRGANTDVSVKRKTNSWPIMDRFLQAMSVPPVSHAETTKMPHLSLHDAQLNLDRRATAAMKAAIQKFEPFSKYMEDSRRKWSKTIADRAEELTDREICSGVLHFGYRSEGWAEKKAVTLLCDGTRQVYIKIKSMREAKLAHQIAESVKAAQCNPESKVLRLRLRQVLYESLCLILERRETIFQRRKMLTLGSFQDIKALA